MQQEILIHDKERVHLQFVFHAAHDLKQLVAGLEEINEFPLASEKCRSRTEVAPHGTTHRRNNGCCGRTLALGHSNAHNSRAHSGNNRRMPDWRALILTQVTSHPANPFSADNVIGIDQRFDAGNGRHMPAYNNPRSRRKDANHAAHLAHLAQILGMF